MDKINPAVAARIKELLLSGARLTGSRLDRLRVAAAETEKHALQESEREGARSWANVAAGTTGSSLLPKRSRAGRSIPGNTRPEVDDHAYVKSELQRAFQMADEIERSRQMRTAFKLAKELQTEMPLVNSNGPPRRALRRGGADKTRRVRVVDAAREKEVENEVWHTRGRGRSHGNHHATPTEPPRPRAQPSGEASSSVPPLRSTNARPLRNAAPSVLPQRRGRHHQDIPWAQCTTICREPPYANNPVMGPSNGDVEACNNESSAPASRVRHKPNQGYARRLCPSPPQSGNGHTLQNWASVVAPDIGKSRRSDVAASVPSVAGSASDSMGEAMPIHPLDVPGGVTDKEREDEERYILLTKEVRKFATFCRVSQQQRWPCILGILANLEKIVRMKWPGAEVTIYGSYVTGLALPSSDVDFVITLPGVSSEHAKKFRATWQSEIATELGKCGWVLPHSLKIIEHTAIPIVTLLTSPCNSGEANAPNNSEISVGGSDGVGSGDLVGVTLNEIILEAPAMHNDGIIDLKWGGNQSHNGQGSVGENTMAAPGTGPTKYSCNNEAYTHNGDDNNSIQVDISFGGPTHRGVQTSTLLLSMSHKYPDLVPLILTLKQFLKERDLCTTYTGGLSSYALSLMVACFLRRAGVTNSTEYGTGHLLLHFLDFFGRAFDASRTGIGGVGTNYTDRSHSRYTKFAADPLYIEDPNQEENNVGRCCFRITQIQHAWSASYKILMSHAPTHGFLLPYFIGAAFPLM